MPHFTKLTPNLVVANVERSLAFAGRPIGATGTMFIELDESVDALHNRLKSNVKVVMPLVTQFYGLREFAIEDPDGYILTFAERQR